jgi:hypothetical protein
MSVMNEAEESLHAHTFPSTLSEFVGEHGDIEFELPNGAARLGDVLEIIPEETLQTERDARMTIYGTLGEDAIGRKGYSDRDPFQPGEMGYSPLSL